MRVEIDSHSGFCFGVVRAISRAEEALQEQSEVFSLGDIVHNRVEVQRLERLGMHTVTHDQMPELGGRSLFIRAHGEPPSTYRLAEELGIELIDATCPVVAKLQRRVVEAHEKMRQVGGQVVILGKRGHAEVIGLTGQVEAPTLVVETEEDLDRSTSHVRSISFRRPRKASPRSSTCATGCAAGPPTLRRSSPTTRSAARYPIAKVTSRSSQGDST